MKRQVFSFLFVTCTRGFEKHSRIILMGTSHQPVLPKNFTEGRCHKIRIYLELVEEDLNKKENKIALFLPFYCDYFYYLQKIYTTAKY